MNRFGLRHIAALILCSSALFPYEGRGQEGTPSPLLGTFISYEYGLPLSLERSPGSVEWCAFCDGTGTSYDHRGRFGASLQLFNRKGFITDLRLSLGVASGEFTSNSYVTLVVDPSTNETVQTDRMFTVSSLVGSLGAQVELKGTIANGWGYGGGAYLDYWLFTRFIHRESILSPAEITYPGTTDRTRILNEGSLLGSGPISFGGILSTSYEIPLSSRFQLVPELYTRIDAWGITNGLGLRAMSIGTSLSLIQNNPSPSLPPEFSIPDPPLPPPPPRSSLQAGIDLYALDEEGNKVDQIEPLPRRTFFYRHTPPVGEQIVEDYVLPSIGVTPFIDPAENILSWSLSIRRDGEEIVHVTSEDADPSLNLAISYDNESPPSTLTAELIVEDSTGKMTAARDRLPFVPGNPSLNHLERATDLWILERKGNGIEKGILQEIARRAKSYGSEVEIVSPDEKNPENPYRKELVEELHRIAPDLEIVYGTREDIATIPLASPLPANSLLLLVHHPYQPEE